MKFKNTRLEKVYTTTEGYFSRKKELEAELKKASTEYTGQRLKTETESIGRALTDLRNDAISSVQNICSEMLQKLNERQEEISKESAALDAKAITPDYEFLRLPVRLTETEIMTLHNRNINDALFNRALQQYVADNGILMHSPLADAFTEKRNTIGRLVDNFSKFILTSDSTVFSVYTKCGSLTEIDNILADL